MVLSKSDYSVSTVYYNNLDAGQHTTKGKSYKSYQIAVTYYDLMWTTYLADNLDTELPTIADNVIVHLICSVA